MHKLTLIPQSLAKQIEIFTEAIFNYIINSVFYSSPSSVKVRLLFFSANGLSNETPNGTWVPDKWGGARVGTDNIMDDKVPRRNDPIYYIEYYYCCNEDEEDEDCWDDYEIELS